MNEITEENLGIYMRAFQLKHGNFKTVDEQILKDFALTICNDIPFGYEASHRLANWIFSYLNTQEANKVTQLSTNKMNIMYSDGFEICQCGLCRTYVEQKDKFCSNCGARFVITTNIKKKDYDEILKH